MGELKRAFRPEFLNRVDDIIVFQQLTQPDIEEIARRMLRSLDKRLAGMELHAAVSEAAVAELAKEGRCVGRSSPNSRIPWRSICWRAGSRRETPSV